jgi:hypothetical protein
MFPNLFHVRGFTGKHGAELFGVELHRKWKIELSRSPIGKFVPSSLILLLGLIIAKNYVEATGAVRRRDTLLLYTDGITESRNELGRGVGA